MFVDECVVLDCAGAAPVARVALSLSTFQGLQNTLSKVDIRNMKAGEWQREVRMGTATDRHGSALFLSEGAC